MRIHAHPGVGRAASAAGAVLLALSLAAGAATAAAAQMHEQAPGAIPFFPGERFVFRVRVAKLGTVGRGSLAVEGPHEVRDRSTWLLRFDFQTRIGLVSVRDNTRSWLDPRAMAAHRFQKEERHPLSSSTQSVELYPSERRWEAADGERGSSPSDAPLDELSFIYFIRTLPLRAGDSYSFNRHFEPGRNPVAVQVVRRQELTVPAGTFPVIVVEMRVKDGARFRGEGLVRLYLSDDGCRMPVQIESTLPVFGQMALSLESHTHPAAHFAAR